MSDRVQAALVNVTDAVIDQIGRRGGSFAARATVRRLCLDIRREYPDFPEPDAILDAQVPAMEQVTPGLPVPVERWSTVFRGELQTLLSETGTPERNAALLSALAQLHCDATVILIARPNEVQ